ncbi:MAG: hypothetical protein ACFE7R_02265, partial [Candidatus Hodarchaeota archaeon]
MASQYTTINLGDEAYSCIEFDYKQDPTGFGEPQNTTLAYDLETGLLVRADTSFTFLQPYHLFIELSNIDTPSPTLPDISEILLLRMIVVASVVIIVLVGFVILRRR